MTVDKEPAMSIIDRLDEVEDDIHVAFNLRKSDPALAVVVEQWAPDMLAALRAVLDLHEGAPNAVSSLYPDPACNECGQTMPCPTVRAIAAALGEES